MKQTIIYMKQTNFSKIKTHHRNIEKHRFFPDQKLRINRKKFHIKSLY